MSENNNQGENPPKKNNKKKTNNKPAQPENAEAKKEQPLKKENTNQPKKENVNQPKKENANQPKKENANQPKKENANQPKKENANQPKKENANQPKKEKEEKGEAKEKIKKPKGRGLVRAVLSGDTIVILPLFDNPAQKNRAFVEPKEITLSNINAPLLGRQGSKDPEKDKKEEPWAWESREHLRKKCIGKQVNYVINNSLKSENSNKTKDYGSVFLLNEDKKTNTFVSQENLAIFQVRAGYAEVRNREIPRSDVEDLCFAEDAAKKEGKGMHTTKKGASEKSLRFVPDSNTVEIYQRMKAKPQTGLVEHIIDGSTFKIILPNNHTFTLLLSGVEAPQKNRDSKAWPAYGKEAKFLAEYKCLHKDVQINFDGADKMYIYGTVTVNGENINQLMLSSGLAKYVDWSGSKSANSDKLRRSEKHAQDNNLRYWSTVTPEKPQKPKTKEEKKMLRSGKEIHGKCIEVINPNKIKVQDQADNEFVVLLSSVDNIKLDQSNNKKEKDEPADKNLQEKEKHLMHEGREVLRRTIIGQNVRCFCDYVRETKQDNKAIAFYSVYFEKKNVAIDLVARGLLEVHTHFRGEERTKDYEKLLKASEQAQTEKKGLYNTNKLAPTQLIQNYICPKPDDKNLDFQGALKRCRDILPHIQKKSLKAVVQFVISATKYKVWIPRENIECMVALSAVKIENEFSDVALKATRPFLFQKEIELEVLGVDKAGSFLANVSAKDIKGTFASWLLREGWAILIYGAARDNILFNEMYHSEDTAKRNKKGLWAKRDLEQEKEEKEKKKQNQNSQKQEKEKEFTELMVSEINDDYFYWQDCRNTKAIEELQQSLSLAEVEDDAYTPKEQEIVRAKFTADDHWYRAQVLSIESDKYKVQYIDYGNVEAIPNSRIRKIDPRLQEASAYAKKGGLAFINFSASPDDEEYKKPRLDKFHELVQNKTLRGTIEYQEAGVPYFSLLNQDSDIAKDFLSTGLVRVQKARNIPVSSPKLDELRKTEEHARSRRLGVFEYGDRENDEDQERGRQGPPNKKKPTKKEEKKE